MSPWCFCVKVQIIMINVKDLMGNHSNPCTKTRDHSVMYVVIHEKRTGEELWIGHAWLGVWLRVGFIRVKLRRWQWRSWLPFAVICIASGLASMFRRVPMTDSADLDESQWE